MIFLTEEGQTVTGDVIIVEDDPMMQSILADLFKELGAESSLFVTADDALIALLGGSAPPSMIITDFTLPGQLNGLELAQMTYQQWPNVPVILTSGYGPEVAQGLPPTTLFIQKPWSVAQMIEAVLSFDDYRSLG